MHVHIILTRLRTISKRQTDIIVDVQFINQRIRSPGEYDFFLAT